MGVAWAAREALSSAAARGRQGRLLDARARSGWAHSPLILLVSFSEVRGTWQLVEREN